MHITIYTPVKVKNQWNERKYNKKISQIFFHRPRFEILLYCIVFYCIVFYTRTRWMNIYLFVWVFYISKIKCMHLRDLKKYPCVILFIYTSHTHWVMHTYVFIDVWKSFSDIFLDSLFQILVSIVTLPAAYPINCRSESWVNSVYSFSET